MKLETYLIIEGKKSRYARGYEARIIHARSNKPKLGKSQIAIKIELELTDNIFDTIIPIARLEVGERHVLMPEIVALDPNDGEEAEEEIETA